MEAVLSAEKWIIAEPAWKTQENPIKEIAALS